MKKSILGIAALMAAAAFTGCNQNPAQEEQSAEKEVPESTGENPFANKKISNGTVSYTFNSDGTAVMVPVSTSEASSRAVTASAAAKSEYYYSWNTENKELYIQLTKVWESDEGKTYLSELEKAKSIVSTTETAAKTAADKSLAALELFASELKTFDISAESVRKAADAKLDAVFAAENTKLEEYLAGRYKSVITYTYTIAEDGSTVTLTQKCPSSLKEADAKYTNDTIVLNDYETFRPFYVKNDSKEYAGVPEFDETKKTLSVILCDYFGNITEDSSAAQKYSQNLTSEITSAMSELLSSAQQLDITMLKTIDTEAKASADGSSATFNALVDKKIQQGTLTASYDNTTTANSLTLTFTADETLLSKLGLSSSATLTFAPLYDAAVFSMTSAN